MHYNSISKENKQKFTFNREQLIRLFDTINDSKVMIGVFIGRLGLRVEEVCQLKWENVDLDNRVIYVLNSKWKFRRKDGYGKDREVRIPMWAISPIEKWKKIVAGGIWILPSDKTPDVPMRKKTLYGQYHHYLELAGLGDVHFEFTRSVRINGKKVVQKCKRYKYNFHSLRSYYITDARRRGIEVEIVAEQVGHVDLNTTRGYNRLLKEEKNKMIDDCYEIPAENIYQKKITQPTIQQFQPATNQLNIQTLKPIEFLQMQMLKGQITKEEYSEKLALLNP